MGNNKVTYGLEQVHIAFVDPLAAQQPAWSVPIAIPGAVKLTPAPQGQESTFYADNGLYWTHTTNNGYTADLEMALFPDTVLKDMLGWFIDDNGMLVEVSDGTPKEFALMGQIQGDAKNRRFVYYFCKANRPTKEHATKGETVEPTTEKASLVIRPLEVEINGKKKNIVKGTMDLSDTNAAAYNAFFNAVPVPTVTPVP